MAPVSIKGKMTTTENRNTQIAKSKIKALGWERLSGRQRYEIIRMKEKTIETARMVLVILNPLSNAPSR